MSPLQDKRTKAGKFLKRGSIIHGEEYQSIMTDAQFDKQLDEKNPEKDKIKKQEKLRVMGRTYCF